MEDEITAGNIGSKYSNMEISSEAPHPEDAISYVKSRRDRNDNHLNNEISQNDICNRVDNMSRPSSSDVSGNIRDASMENHKRRSGITTRGIAGIDIAAENVNPEVHNVQPTLSVAGQSKVDKLLPGFEEASQAPSQFMVFVKWIVILIFFALFLACIVGSKLTVIHMTTLLHVWQNETAHDTHAKTPGQESMCVMLLLTMMIPYATTLIRSVWNGGFRSDLPWPSKRSLVWGLTSAVAEAAGLTLFTFDVLPNSPRYIGLLLMNGVFFIPIICQVAFSFRRHKRGIRSESKCATGILVLALFFAVAAFPLTAFFEIGFTAFPNWKLWEIPLSILLLSYAWCPHVQKQQLDPERATLQKLVKRSQATTQMHHPGDADSIRITQSNTSSPAYSARTLSVNCLKDPEELPVAWAHPQFSSRWKMAIIGNTLKLLLIPAFTMLWVYTLKIGNIDNLYTGLLNINVTHPAFYCLLISVFTSFLGYLVGWASCVMGLHKTAFIWPLILSTPVALIITLVPLTCTLTYDRLPVSCTLDIDHRPEITLPAAVFLYISQVLSVAYFIYKTVTIILPTESQIFWFPGYNSIFLEQHLLLNRKNKQTDASHEDPNIKAQKTKVYICTTMYRESAREMEQLLKSYARINKAKQRSDRHFQAHIFLDNGVKGTRLTPFALQLTSIITQTLGVSVADGTKVATPYGMSLSWILPTEVMKKQGMYMTVHLKDNRKVKNKKRWSQIMYMSYVLDFTMREDKTATDEDTFILTTDADIQFAPASVEALLDLMARDKTVGAVCSRTHPMGSGPLCWFQIFQYAIGHWLQKVANHVLGSVLCCPGCFSVFRAGALRDVIAIYGSNVTHASEFLTKDMGEDRWLCTLMVQAGWRLDYCAAAENSTYCPEEFDEFFKQQRRWIPSSLANLVVLMQEWKTMYYFNKQISLAFILYQGILLVSALLNPSVCIIIIVGGLFYAWEVSQACTMTLMILVAVFYTWICLSTSQETQLKVAKFLTIIFALVMAVVVIGMCVKIVTELNPEPESTTVMPSTTPRYNRSAYEDPFLNPNELLQAANVLEDPTQSYLQNYINNVLATPQNSTAEPETEDQHLTAYYLFGMIGIFFITGLMHLDEIHCLVHGLWYLLTLPAGNLILIIYSICNITDRSWGTREEKKAPSFSDGTDWKATVTKWMRKICFCCDNKKPVDPPLTTADDTKEPSLAKPSPERSRLIRQPDSISDEEVGQEEDWRLDSGSSRQSHASVERKLSFRFHYDEQAGADAVVSVRNWLPSHFRKKYAPLFITNGYEDTTFLSGITEQEIAAVGISSKTVISAIHAEIKLLPEFEIEPCVPENAEEWLKYIGLEMYKLNFQRSCIVSRSHLEILRTMNKQDIEKELGIKKPGHLRRLRIAIESLRYPTPEEQKLAEVKMVVERLKLFDLKELGPREYDFWEALKKAKLQPDSVDLAHDLELKEKLTELRDNVILIFAVSNALWLILIETLVTKEKLRVLHTTALDLVFIVIFGFVLVLMFLCMIVHRLSTWMHMVARAPMCCGDPYNTSWSWGEHKRSPSELIPEADNQGNEIEDSVEVSANQQKRDAADRIRQRNQGGATLSRNLSPVTELIDSDDDEDIVFDDRTNLIV